MNRIETAYADIDIRVYLMFAKEDALIHAMNAVRLTEDEQKEVLKCGTPCSMSGTCYHTLVVPRKPGKQLPRAYHEMAALIYEQYPLETHYVKRKDRDGTYIEAALNDFGFDLPVYSGKLHNL